MKQVRVINNRPAKGQSSIAHLIGETFDVIAICKDDDKPNGQVQVSTPDLGTIVLQHNEYEIVKP